MKMNRIAAVLMAVLMLVLCALPAAAEEDQVFVRVNNQTITVSEAQAKYDEMVDYYSAMYAEYGLDFTQEDADSMADYIVSAYVEKLVEDEKIAEMGLGEITEEDKAGLMEQAQEEYDSTKAECLGYFKSMYMYYDEEMTEEEAAAAAEADAEAYMADYSVESIYESLVEQLPYERLRSAVVESCEVTDEQVVEYYNNQVASDMELLGDVESYEFYTLYYGYEPTFRPEGYRTVQYVMLDIPEEIRADMIDYETDMMGVQDTLNELNEELASLENQSEDSETEPRTADEINADIEAATAKLDELNTAYEALKATAIPAVQGTVDEIVAAYNAGTPFAELIEKYNTDTEMALTPDGIAIHPESVWFDTAMRDAACALTEEAPLSGAVVGDYGVYIILYQGEIPGGAIELTDEEFGTYRADLLSSKQDEFFNETLEGWIEAADQETHIELLTIPEYEEASVG